MRNCSEVEFTVVEALGILNFRLILASCLPQLPWILNKKVD